MGAFDIGELAGSMVGAAREVLSEDWPEARKFMESEARKFASSVEEITEWLASGDIDEEGARFLLSLHAQSMKMVLVAGKGIGLVMAERAVNAALGAIRDLVNGVVRFELL